MKTTEKRPLFTTRELCLCGLFAALIAVGAFIKVTIPVQPSPMHFTMQWFFVLLAGFLLRPRSAAASVSTYLLIGLMGVPIFARGGGISYLFRPTFGFLLGFAFAAFLISYLCEKLHSRTLLQLMVPATAGLLVYYLSGMIYGYVCSRYVLGAPLGWQVILINYCLLTIFEDFLLCVLAAVVVVRLRPALKQFLYD